MLCRFALQSKFIYLKIDSRIILKLYKSSLLTRSHSKKEFFIQMKLDKLSEKTNYNFKMTRGYRPLNRIIFLQSDCEKDV
jgi:hypothetical protein